MRLAEGIVVDEKETFGTLLFSEMRRESFTTDEQGNVTTQIKGRTYDLKSSAQQRMIQVTLPAEVQPKAFNYNDKVKLVNPVVDTVANATFRGADVSWYIKADDILLVTENKQGIGKEKQVS
ncbi:YdcP family protein [Vagococcus acidifermentans]|uniref:Conjugal transfer protein n=1 Tax=Vagococcus acidifermentans TaxID=564710 RepID=A0A430ANQ7_9ENTE|nr:YdcP family protein [Vagococcus acidifermentans]RSU09810.1 conjugal transfer protein [Vagococcus acidifermentans]